MGYGVYILLFSLLVIGWSIILVFSNGFQIRLNFVPEAAVVLWRRLSVFGYCSYMIKFG
jgi:hypothetical protein